MSELLALLVLAAQITTADPVASAAPTSATCAAACQVMSLPGEDKFRHFGASYGATAMTFGAMRALDRDAAMPVAVSVAAAVGIAKELHDLRRKGVFDFADLAANAAGIAAAYFFLREIR
jgi:hypothetical protein